MNVYDTNAVDREGRMVLDSTKNSTLASIITILKKLFQSWFGLTIRVRLARLKRIFTLRSPSKDLVPLLDGRIGCTIFE